MTYYPTLAEDIARAKEILERGRVELGTVLIPGFPHDGDTKVRAHLQNLLGGAIYGMDNYAAYKLLESFVAELAKLTPEGECICRTPSCGHGARFHGLNGACVVCGKECWY